MVKTALSSAMGVGKSRKASELRRKLLGGPSALLVDPLGFDAGDSNLYRYVSNEPNNNVDPLGNQQLSPEIMGANFGAGKQAKFYAPMPLGAPFRVTIQPEESFDAKQVLALKNATREAIFEIQKAYVVLKSDVLFKRFIKKNEDKLAWKFKTDPVKVLEEVIDNRKLWTDRFGTVVNWAFHSKENLKFMVADRVVEEDVPLYMAPRDNDHIFVTQNFWTQKVGPAQRPEVQASNMRHELARYVVGINDDARKWDNPIRLWDAIGDLLNQQFEEINKEPLPPEASPIPDFTIGIPKTSTRRDIDGSIYVRPFQPPPFSEKWK
jgi:hypothetical protein